VDDVSPAIPEPFFLVGAERSGTTLLRLMLSHHPEIECAPEFEFLVQRMPAPGVWPDLEEYRAWLATSRIFVPHALEIDESLDYPALVRSFVDQHRERSGKPIGGATCHLHFERLDSIWPEARYVHLLRDGRDVARSCIGMGWEGNVWYGAERWIVAVSTWARLSRSIPDERRLELRFEDLVVDPEATLGRLCEFLGTDFDPAMMDYAESSTYSRPDPALIEQWRRKLDPEALALLEARIGGLLRENGYRESGVPPARVGAARRWGLYLDNRRRRFRARRERYGLSLILADRLSRSLGLKGLQEKVILARNEIDNRHVK
jgi:hypothetical protein